jgi:hypothetical protein
MTKRPTYRARALMALAAALAIAAVALAPAASRASAATSDPHCNYDGRTFNACISFEYLGYYWYNAHVGLDIWLPEQYAREAIACGQNFTASLWADGHYVRDLAVAPGWPIAQASGIAVQFIGAYVYGDLLSEDKIYARISFNDCHTNVPRTFTTGVIRN